MRLPELSEIRLMPSVDPSLAMIIPSNVYQCPSCKTEFSRPAFAICAGSNYTHPPAPPRPVGCDECSVLFIVSELPILRVEWPEVDPIDEASIPPFLRHGS
jgi:hypothetical protein